MLELAYRCDPASLGALASRFVELNADASTHAWIAAARATPASRLRLALHALARVVMSDYDANGLLGVHDMRVLGTEQWRKLLGNTAGSLLDIGAGDGAVTAELAPLFDRVETTETSPQMAKRLRHRGFTCHATDIAHAPLDRTFDCVSLLNVLDRTSFPRTLLRSATRMVVDGGRLVVAVPLPLRPHVHIGPLTVDPEEPLPDLRGDWSKQARAFAEDVLETADLRVLVLSRAPYLCRGSRSSPVAALDDAIFVVERVSDSSPRGNPPNA